MTDEWTYTDDEPMTAKEAINELQEHITRNANIDRQAMIGELERLRAALEQIVAADDNYKAASNFMKDSFSDGYSDGLHDAAYVARTALKGSTV